MKNITIVFAGFMLIILFPGMRVFAQNPDCQVKMPEISGNYTGGCKKGLANGKGVAQGTDHYEGHFINGLPHGSGRYTWADGTYYDGTWKEGLMDGKGKLVSRESTKVGFWKDNVYVGTELIRPYQVTKSLSVARSTFMKTSSSSSQVRMKLMMGGVENIDVEDLNLAYSSGQEYRSGSWISLQNVTFPVDVKVTYRSWNQLHSVQFNVIFEFTISEPGSWEVTISN